MLKLETERLIIQHITANDAQFIYELVNDPDWIKYIGDRYVKTIADAENYISEKIIKSYEQYGFGLYLVSEKQSGVRAGICGILKRDYLDDPDIGFAFLPRFRGKGFTFESASAIINYGKEKFGIKKLSAVTQADNVKSIKVLKNLGFKFFKNFQFPGEVEELNVFEKEI